MPKDVIFNEEVYSALDFAKKYAAENHNAEYGAAHLLKAILHRDLSLLKELETMKKDVFFIEEWAEVRIDDFPKSLKPADPEPDESIDKITQEADEIRDVLGRDEIDLYCIMTALATPGVGFNFDQMKSFPISRGELLAESAEKPTTEEAQEAAQASIKYLYKYCKDKLLQAKKQPKNIVAREKEIKEIEEIICRFSKPHVLLQGYSGVGKTALIEGFINLVVKKQVPDKLAKTKIYELDLGTFIAGASYKGEIEDRLKKILHELKTFPQTILIIDGIHLLLDKNSDNAGISSILKSELADSSGLTLIAATTVDEYTKKIEKDENLSGMFEVLKVEEPTEEQAFRIIKSALQSYLKHHEIEVSDESISESIRLSKRYLKEKSLPESALSLLDRTMSVIKTAGISFLKEKESLTEKLQKIKENSENQKLELKWFWEDLSQKAQYLLIQEGNLNENFENFSEEGTINYFENLLEKLSKIAETKKDQIEPIDLDAVVAQKTGIPLGKLQSEEKDRLQNMENILRRRVVGQDYAIQVVTEAVLESRSGLSKAGQPMGSFFFLGPTGTGKTELAKALADFLFQDEQAIIRFDMSEFKEEHSAALLYGAPPGYVGYEEGGQLTEAVRKKPYSVVLLDEIEKAHPDVFNILLQIMDDGFVTDSLGRKIDFRNTIIIMTSNIGTRELKDFGDGVGFGTAAKKSSSDVRAKTTIENALKKAFAPEFLNRIDDIIVFNSLGKEDISKIIDIELEKVYERLEKLGYHVELSAEAKEFITEKGWDKDFGARPLKRAIQKYIEDSIAEEIINAGIQEGNRLLIDLNEAKDDVAIKKLDEKTEEV